MSPYLVKKKLPDCGKKKKKKVLLGQSNLNFLSMFIWLQDDFYLQPSCFVLLS